MSRSLEETSRDSGYHSIHHPAPSLECRSGAKMDAAALDPRPINLEDSWTILEEGHLSQEGQWWAYERYATEEAGREWHKTSLCIMAFRGAWRLSHTVTGYRWSAASLLFCISVEGRIDRLDLGTRVPASLLCFCTSEELISRVI